MSIRITIYETTELAAEQKAHEQLAKMLGHEHFTVELTDAVAEHQTALNNVLAWRFDFEARFPPVVPPDPTMTYRP